MLGACHACANPLTAHYGITHGMAIGILLPHVIRFNAAAVAPLYGELARRSRAASTATLGGAGEVLAQRITDLMQLAELADARCRSAASAGASSPCWPRRRPSSGPPASTRGR